MPNRELAFCTLCGQPGTTTNPDEDYVCSDCQEALAAGAR